MPRVVPDQRTKFENDELFRKLSRESEVCTVCIHACWACVQSFECNVDMGKPP